MIGFFNAKNKITVKTFFLVYWYGTVGGSQNKQVRSNK